MGRLCPRCGKMNRDHARFCSGCGLDLAAAGYEKSPGRHDERDYERTVEDRRRRGDADLRFGRNQMGENPFSGEPEAYRHSESPRDLSGYRPGEGGGYGGYSPEPEIREKGSGARTALLAFAAVIALAIIGLSIYAVRSNFSGRKDTAENVSTSSAGQESTTSGAGSDLNEESTISEPGAEQNGEEVEEEATESISPPPETEESYSMDESGFAYCNNDRMSFESHTDVGDFQIMTSQDVSFSFSYPKYIFNHSEMNSDGTEYYFCFRNEYGEDEFSLRYRKTYDPGSPKERAVAAQNGYKSQYVQTSYTSDYERNKSGGHQYVTIASGYLNSTKDRGQYSLAENDGTYTYRMEFIYDEYQGEKKKYLQYIINNVYRQCSFAMSKKSPVSYEKMVEEKIFD